MKERLYSLEFDTLPPEIEAKAFPNGPYAKSKPIDEEKYEKRLRKLQIELVKLQHSVISKGERSSFCLRAVMHPARAAAFPA